MPTAQPIARHGASLAASARGGAVGAGSVALLRDARGGAVPLQRVAARGRLQGLLFELTVEQHYRNAGPTTLESVFTFPLPLRAALLGFELEIGERKLSAVAAARRDASERYERAIDEGDTAALIECAGDGLHTVSVGNLRPGETAVIRYRYAELLDAHEGHVRLAVPTAIAPRYGNPADAGLEGPAIPGTELLAEYPFEIRIELDGITEAGVVHSPSHTVAVSPGPTGLTVALARPGYLDRDFVLEVEQAATPARALVAADGDGYVALAGCTLALDRAEHRPLALKILLDCSGSMGGDSIAAAKRALLGILDSLGPEDRISLTRFGSTVEQVSEGLEPADKHTLAPLRAVVAGLDADLGGTEMAGALATVLALPVPAGRQADVILVTDGEIYDIAGVIERTAKSGQRLFAIAIGAAPVEALARGLADRTGSACEFVAPGENAEAAILRTFKRLRAAPRSLARVTWPSEPAWTALPSAAVFPGDTLHVMAGFKTRPEAGRDIEVLVRDRAEGETRIVVRVAQETSEGDLIARMAAHRRIGTLDEPEATALALKYQLASRYTSLVVVAERSDAEKAKGLPVTVAVPNMLASGWAGSALALSMPAAPRMQMASFDQGYESADLGTSHRAFERGSVDEYLSIPELLGTSEDFASELDSVIRSVVQSVETGGKMPTTLGELVAKHGLPQVLRVRLSGLVAAPGDEAIMVGVFLALLVERFNPTRFDPKVIDRLKGSWLARRRHRGLRQRILKEVLAI